MCVCGLLVGLYSLCRDSDTRQPPPTSATSVVDASTVAGAGGQVGITSEVEYLRKYMLRHHTAEDEVLTKEAPPGSSKAALKDKLKPLLEYWKRATNADYGEYPKPGRDLYIYMFPVQLILLFWILFGYNSLAQGGRNSANSFSSNRLSGMMVCDECASCLLLETTVLLCMCFASHRLYTSCYKCWCWWRIVSRTCYGA